MAGVELSVTVDDRAVKAAIRQLLGRTGNLRPMFDDVGASLVTSTRQRFEDEEDPQGKRWPALKDSTKRGYVTRGQKGKRRRGGVRRGGEHILRNRGHLYDSITHLASPLGVRVGSNRKYAALQQFGGTDKMPPGAAAVPARAFVGLSAADRIEIAETVLDHLRT